MLMDGRGEHEGRVMRASSIGLDCEDRSDDEVHGQAIGTQALAQSSFPFASVVSYAQLRAALITQNAPGSETLPLTDPTGRTLRLGRAEEKALGFLTDNSKQSTVGLVSQAVPWQMQTSLGSWPMRSQRRWDVRLCSSISAYMVL
jgi:hypothetical protein